MGNTTDSPRALPSSDLFARALAVVKDRTFVSCTILGEELWATNERCKGRQSYARPAGKLIKRLLTDKLIKPALQTHLGYSQRVGDAPLYCLTEQPMHPRYSRANVKDHATDGACDENQTKKSK